METHCPGLFRSKMTDAQKQPFQDLAQRQAREVKEAKASILGFEQGQCGRLVGAGGIQTDVPMPAVHWEGGVLRATSFLGEGTYSRVWRVSDPSGQEFAAKIVKQELSDIQDEFALMRLLAHPNIMNCHSILADSLSVGLLLELGDSSLHDWLTLHALDWPPSSVASRACFEKRTQQRWKFAFQMARGLGHCHQMRVLHGDVKVSNMVVKSNAVQLSDFGLAVRLDANNRIRVVGRQMYSPGHRPPECKPMMVTITVKADCWAAGCALYSLMAHSGSMALFPNGYDVVATTGLETYLEQRFRIRMTHSSAASALVKMLVAEDASKRSDMLQIVAACSGEILE